MSCVCNFNTTKKEEVMKKLKKNNKTIEVIN